MVVEWCRSIAENRRFQFAIIGVIVLNAVIIGLETSPAIMRAFEPVLRALNVTVQAIFIGELAIRLRGDRRLYRHQPVHRRCPE
jgi:voltage-gated sodium channel